MSDYYPLIIPWVMFGGFVAIVLAGSSNPPKWYKRLPSDDARFVACTGAVVFFPLLLVAGATMLVFYVVRTTVRGLRDVVRHVRSRESALPKATARQK